VQDTRKHVYKTFVDILSLPIVFLVLKGMILYLSWIEMQSSNFAFLAQFAIGYEFCQNLTEQTPQPALAYPE